jgi:hypothetical protein
VTSSFTSDSLFYLSNENFITNKEIINQNQLISGIRDRVSDKIEIKSNILAEIPSGSNSDINTLSPFQSIQQSSKTSGSFTENVNYLEVAFSPQNQINDDIISQLGNFNLGEYIGDPRHISSPTNNYPDLDRLRDAYFEKYIHSYDVKDFIRLIKFFDNSLFRMIKDFTPARTSLSSGIVVKQHILERNRIRPAQITSSNETYEGTVKPFSRGYDTGSGDTGQYEYISGSSIYRFKGETGGVFEQFNGIEFHPNTVNNRFDITQSWNESFPTTSGSINYLRDDQREFYNGEFSGSAINVKLQRGFTRVDDNISLADPCSPFIKIDPNDFYLYNLIFYSGSDAEYAIIRSEIPDPEPNPITPGDPPITPIGPSSFVVYFNSSAAPYGWSTSSEACQGTGTMRTVWVDGYFTTIYAAYLSGKALHTTSDLDVLVDGGNTYWKTVSAAQSGETFYLSSLGVISQWDNSCSPPSPPSPISDTWYYGTLTQTGSNLTLDDPNVIDMSTGIARTNPSPSSITIPISFNSGINDFNWFAIPKSFDVKTFWYVDIINQGTIGGPPSLLGNLFPDPYDKVYNDIEFNLYITYQRTPIPTIQISNIEL